MPEAATGLGLAAAPTFAAMAVLIATLGGGGADLFCGSALAWNGMVPMYALMSAFHLGPWLKLIAGRRQPHDMDGTRAG